MNIIYNIIIIVKSTCGNSGEVVDVLEKTTLNTLKSLHELRGIAFHRSTRRLVL